MDRRPQSRAPDTRHHDVASDAGGRRAAAIYSLIASAKLNGLNPQHYFADLLARIADHPVHKLDELLPWNWRPLNAPEAVGEASEALQGRKVEQQIGRSGNDGPRPERSRVASRIGNS